MKSIPFLALAALAGSLGLCACAPKDRATPSAASHTKAASAFTVSATLHLGDLTLEDYALLNRNMDELLKRVGLADCKGYLIPAVGLHGAIQPELVVHGNSDPKAISNSDLDSLVGRFSRECEKVLSSKKEPNQASEPTRSARGSP
jgi:hypothetical protein